MPLGFILKKIDKNFKKKRKEHMKTVLLLHAQIIKLILYATKSDFMIAL